MSGTMEGSQNELEELGKFNQVQWNKFVEDSINKEKKGLKAAEEKSKTNKGKSIEILKNISIIEHCNLLASSGK